MFDLWTQRHRDSENQKLSDLEIQICRNTDIIRLRDSETHKLKVSGTQELRDSDILIFRDQGLRNSEI